MTFVEFCNDIIILMKRSVEFCVAAAAIPALLAFAAAKIEQQPADNSAEVERGRYIVEQLAKCGDCHTQALPNGEPDKSHWLKGARQLSFQPITKPPKWADKSPDLTSTSKLWQKWGEDGVVRFLETGKNPKGEAADPPMPTYTMKADDAEAVAAYLRLLK